jgi:predicted MarR family transcription regulator
LKDEQKNVNYKKDLKKLESTELTNQTRNTCHKTKITTQKANHNKLYTPISNKPNVEGIN